MPRFPASATVVIVIAATHRALCCSHPAVVAANPITGLSPHPQHHPPASHARGRDEAGLHDQIAHLARDGHSKKWYNAELELLQLLREYFVPYPQIVVLSTFQLRYTFAPRWLGARQALTEHFRPCRIATPSTPVSLAWP
ncbi:hypothetical protein N657DRAFT_644655 [Parathielavia appendiculata]|uniref:Uncharacterized protein n=1 Tax=Parathielavia appendiculata TaxID=2587402 RepID=A0AAN6U3F1_9PEZI|nr:hypothetical protein N657DRAFT_644655 [Parathielavia appendiculata]